MADIIAIAIVACLVIGAGTYIYKQKKQGVRCIGCPSGKECNGHCSGCGH